MIGATALYITGMSIAGHVFFGSSLLIAICRAAISLHKFSEAQKILDNQNHDVKEAIYKAAAAFSSPLGKNVKH